MYAQAATRTGTGMFSCPNRPGTCFKTHVLLSTIQNQNKINPQLVTPKKSEYESEKKRCLEEKLVR